MTEQAIIRGCQQQVAKYQRELVLRYSPMLMTVARRYARDEAMAKDVLQEALIKVLRAIPDYQPTGSFSAWLRRITITTALQTLDKSCFRREVGNIDELSEPVLHPEVYSHLGAEELMTLIGRLPQGFKQVFNLFVVEGYSHKEIAKIMDITESTSRSQLTRARKQLQALLTQREKIRV